MILQDGQRIHIRPQRHHRRATADLGHDPGASGAQHGARAAGGVLPGVLCPAWPGKGWNFLIFLGKNGDFPRKNGDVSDFSGKNGDFDGFETRFDLGKTVISQKRNGDFPRKHGEFSGMI